MALDIIYTVCVSVFAEKATALTGITVSRQEGAACPCAEAAQHKLFLHNTAFVHIYECQLYSLNRQTNTCTLLIFYLLKLI